MRICWREGWAAIEKKIEAAAVNNFGSGRGWGRLVPIWSGDWCETHRGRCCTRCWRVGGGPGGRWNGLVPALCEVQLLGHESLLLPRAGVEGDQCHAGRCGGGTCAGRRVFRHRGTTSRANAGGGARGASEGAAVLGSSLKPCVFFRLLLPYHLKLQSSLSNSGLNHGFRLLPRPAAGATASTTALPAARSPGDPIVNHEISACGTCTAELRK